MDFATIVTLLDEARARPRDMDVRDVLHDALLERYGAVYSSIYEQAFKACDSARVIRFWVDVIPLLRAEIGEHGVPQSGYAASYAGTATREELLARAFGWACGPTARFGRIPGSYVLVREARR